MKKAFDQTVRELKREVNKKVLKVPGIEQKVLDATSNEPWGPHGSHLADIAQATRNFNEYQIIMTVLWKRLNDTGKNWRHVYKALIVLEYLVAHGSERIIDEVREHAYQISTLSDFQYIDSSGRDQGTNVRKKSQSLVNIVNDKERIQEVRQKAHSNRDKYRGSTGGMYKSSSYSGAVGGYGDHYDEDKYESRYGSKNDDRNGYGREKEWNYKDEDRHGRGSDPYARDGDRYGREYDENYNRDGYRDDEYRGRSSASYHPGQRSRSSDREKTQAYEEDDRYSSRSGGGRGEEYTPDERQLDRKLSARSTGAPPSYEEVVGDTQSHVHVERDGGSVRKDAVAEVSHNETTKDSQLPTASSLNPDLTKDINEFDEFDPRGSAPAAPNSAPSVEHDFLGSLMDTNPLAIVLQEPLNTTTSTSDAFSDSGFGTPFVALSSASAVLNQPAENPFGETPFKAVEQDGAQPHNFTAVSSFPATVAGDGSESLNKPDYGFGESLNGMMFTSEIPVEVSAHFPPEMQLEAQLQSQQFMQPQSQASQQPYMQINAPAQPQPPSYMPSALLPNTQYQPQIQSQASLPPPNTQYQPQLQSQSSLPPPNAQYQPQIQSQSSLSPQFSTQSQQSVDVLANLGLQPMQQIATSSQPTGSAVVSYASQPQAQKDKFEPKSAVWADTINRGLVNLNISGTKVNPLADIGIDFDALNRKEKRREKEKAVPTVSTITMGKAMGSGSGVGRAGASGIAPPANPMVGAGMNMGMGMGGAGAGTGVGVVGVGMGGYGAGMNQSMGTGGYPQQPYGNGMGNMGMAGQMRPPMGMPPSGQGMAGYNPSMGMGGYPQQPYGGYR